MQIYNNITQILSVKSVSTTYRIPRFIVYYQGKTYDNAPANYDGSGYVGSYTIANTLLSTNLNMGGSTSVSSGGKIASSVSSGYYFILHPDTPSPYSFHRWGCYWAEIVTSSKIIPVGTLAFRFDPDGKRIIPASQERLSELLEKPQGINHEKVGLMQVRSADVASDMQSYIKNGILQQAKEQMIAQANGSNNGILKLLG
ncbi:MAG: hypothetical protein IJ764_00435 [Bacteroidales bacterium]|nr:hypothetical protein [Bacteroidales bacterium]